MTTQTERLGVSKADYYFSSKGWLFREQMVHDYGIDAQVEIVNDSYPTGDLIAIQIKSGMSFFSEETDDSYIFRTEDKYVNYWVNHTLPVILILYNPVLDSLFWQPINEDSVLSTGKGWKVLIPKTNVLNDDSCKLISQLTQPEQYIQKLNKLKLDKHWIQKVADGYDVYVEFGDWINKSLTRTKITISCGNEIQIWPMTYGPGLTIEDILKYFIPWANFEMDLDSHREGSESQWDAECYITYDKEEGKAIHSQSFEDWYCEPDGIVPCEEDGEVASYRLHLSLNEIGLSFIRMDSFLSEKNNFRNRTFTIDALRW